MLLSLATRNRNSYSIRNTCCQAHRWLCYCWTSVALCRSNTAAAYFLRWRRRIWRWCFWAFCSLSTVSVSVNVSPISLYFLALTLVRVLLSSVKPLSFCLMLFSV